MDIKERPAPMAELQRMQIKTGFDRLEVLMHGQSEVLEMISRGASLPAILESITTWVELQSPDTIFASILLLDEQGKHLLHGAAPSLPQEYNNAINGVAIGPNVGSCGTAAFTGQTVIVENIQTDPRWQDYKDLAGKFNLHACWSTPLINGAGKLLGTFALYYPEPKKPASEEMEVIKLVTRTAVIAIEHKMAESERQRLREIERFASEMVVNDAEHSEKRFRNLVYEAPVATAIYTGREMRVALANEAMLKVWGKDASVIGKLLNEALPELDGQPFHQLLGDVFTSGESYSANEARADLVVNGKLQPFYFNFTYKPLRDANGNIYAILNMAVDVTESVIARFALEQSEERYRLLATELENRVQERTHDLQRANESLEKSNAELAQYAYVASHDLQEPLRKIRVFSSMLQSRGELNKESGELVSRVIASANRMSQLINDLLEFSRLLNAGRSIQFVDLNEVMRNVMQDFELAIHEKHAEIEIGLLPIIEAVPLQINQLFTNLLSNAFKFSREHSPLKLTMHAKPLAEAERQWYGLAPVLKYSHITFSDNGIGFDPHFAEQIFEVFKRLHSKQAYPGSGIGLALCRKIVENHRGHLFAESEEGKGTAFHIILPERQG